MTRRLRLLIAARDPAQVAIYAALGEELLVCFAADDLHEAIKAAKREQPDVCLVCDDMMPDVPAAVRGIFRAAPGAAVIVLAQRDGGTNLLDSIRAGAIGYVAGRLDAERLRRIVRAAAAHEAVVPRSMVLDLVLELRGGVDGLPARESQVLALLRRGYGTAEIADRLGIAPVTVRRHISELVQKLGVTDRSVLIRANSPSPGREAAPRAREP